MSAFIASKVSFVWKSIGYTVNVPNDPVARLMYYMKSVASVLTIANFEEDIDRLTDYDNYHNISVSDVDKLLVLCQKYQPQVLENRCFFNNEVLCRDAGNTFYEISEAKTEIAALDTSSTSLVVGEMSLTITEIMVYVPSWMDRNYHKPMQTLQPWLNVLGSTSKRPLWQCRVRIQPTYPAPQRSAKLISTCRLT